MAACFSLASHAAADTAYDRCIAASAGVMPAIKACDAKQKESGDGKLNQSYLRVLHTLKPRDQTAFRAVERAWISFRDAECDFRYTAEGGGQDAALVASQCEAELTADRIRQLDAYSKHPR